MPALPPRRDIVAPLMPISMVRARRGTTIPANPRYCETLLFFNGCCFPLGAF
jgi:hypothetical protein